MSSDNDLKVMKFLQGEGGVGIDTFFSTSSHYTSIKSFLQIVESGKFRFSHKNYMNDPMDGRELYKSVLTEIRQELNNKDPFSDNDEFIEKIIERDGIKSSFHEYLIQAIEDFSSGDRSEEKALRLLKTALMVFDIEFDQTMSEGGAIFVASFLSRSEDDTVHFWEMYGDGGKGVCIDFDIFKMVNNIKNNCREFGFDIFVEKVIYLNDYEKFNLSSNIINNFVSKIVIFQGDLFFELREMSKKLAIVSSFYKNYSYRAEEEMRIVCCARDREYVDVCINKRGGLTPFIDISFVGEGYECNDGLKNEVLKIRNHLVFDDKNYPGRVIIGAKLGPCNDFREYVALDQFVRSRNRFIPIFGSSIEYRGR